MTEISIDPMKAITIAVVNAVVVQLRLGYYVSEYNVLRDSTASKETKGVWCKLTGKTDKGVRISTINWLLGQTRVDKKYLVHNVMVEVESVGPGGKSRFFDCALTPLGIIISEVDCMPY